MTDKQCDRCGKVNPAEIHTCSPNYVDRRQWKYDPMTGEPLIDDWPLYSGLPQREWQRLTDEEIKEIVGPWGSLPISGYTRKLFDQIEAKLKEKNT